MESLQGKLKELLEIVDGDEEGDRNGCSACVWWEKYIVNQFEMKVKEIILPSLVCIPSLFRHSLTWYRTR